MLELDDPRWNEMHGGYHVPFDPRPCLEKRASETDSRPVWSALWQELYHQGDIGEASFAAVPHLVRIHRERGLGGWNTYAIVATIELARDAQDNLPIPSWLRSGYERALVDLADAGLQEFAAAKDVETVRSILAILALVKGARTYARLLSEFTQDELLDLEAHAFGDRA
jgi:hypothetical protein